MCLLNIRCAFGYFKSMVPEYITYLKKEYSNKEVNY